MAKLPMAMRPYQNMMISGSILLFCVTGLVFGVIPAVQKVQELFGVAAELRQDNETLARKRDILTGLDENSLRQQLITVLSAVPADRSFPTLFTTVEGIAAQAGVSVRSMSITGGTSLATPSASKATAEEKRIGTKTIPFSVILEGSLPSMQQFIAQAPNVRRLLRLKVFSISFPENERPLNVSIEMDAFYEPLPQTLGTARATLPNLTDTDITVIERLSQFPLATAETGDLPPPIIGKVKENPFLP